LALSREPTACRARLEMSAKALRLAGEAPGMLGLRIRRELLTDLLQCAELERFESELDRYEREGRDLSSPRDIYWAMVLRATEATLHGDLSAGEQLARGAAVRGFDIDPTVAGAEYLQRFVVRFQQNRMSEMPGDAGVEPDPQTAYRGGAALSALAHAETGRIDLAVRTARWAIGPDGHGIAPDSLWLAAHALLAVVAVAADDQDLVALLDEFITPCANQLVTVGAGGAVLGCGHHWLGLLAQARGMPDRAVEHLVAAEEMSTRARAPYWLAQARFDLANVLERRDRAGDRDRADALRADALRTAEAGGYKRILALSALRHPG
jgi:hypothetical protein